MFRKLIYTNLILIASILIAQDITIFFLKDGSIVQGKIVNENQHRIFLKTDQGTIKILPSNILGRENNAKKGDLTYMAEKMDYIQSNMNHVAGKVTHLNDSLKTAMLNLENLFMNLEALQNEFEIDLLRLNSQGRDNKKKIEYLQDDVINQKVEVAGNRQVVDEINDTVSVLNDQFYKFENKLNATSDQTYLITGNLANTKKDIQLLSDIKRTNLTK